MVNDAKQVARGGLSRRALLGGLCVGVGYAAVRPVVRASADGGLVRASPLPDRSWVATSATTLATVSTALGARLEVLSGSVAAGSVIEVSFDERVYAVTDPTLTTAGGESVSCRLTGVVPTNGGGPATATLMLDEPLPTGETSVLVLGIRVLTRYPVDIIASPLPIVIRVNGLEAEWSASRQRFSAGATESVWGLMVGAGWGVVRWGPGFHSWVPEIVTVAATGPGDVPTGTVVTVSLDTRLFPAALLQPLGDSASVQSASTAVGGVTRAVWTLGQPLGAGEHLSARLEAAPVTLNDSVPGLHAPTVTAWAATSEIGQRITGQESTSREDSAYDRSTLATYGLDLTTSRHR